MTTETHTTLQTGTTPNPISSNAQDFSGSDDEIMDNFADGPLPDDADTHDDGTPMGLGGEKGRQSEPANSTLEADIVNGTTKQPGEDTPPENSAGEPEPVEDASETGSEDVPEPNSEGPEIPEFPPALLQMAGLADATAAQAAGFQSPEALFAAIRWRSQLLTPGAQPAQPSEQGLYRRSAPAVPAPTPTPPAPAGEPEGEVAPFQLPADKMGLLDEDLQEVIRQMNDHYQSQNSSQQKELQSLRAELNRREESLAIQQEQNEELQFDEAVQSLGENWKDVFGEGSGRELDRQGQSDPVAMTNINHRRLLFETVQAVREVNVKQGYKPMTLEQEVQWALMQRYPDKFQQIISGKSNGKPGPRRGVTASRPTQRNTPPKSQNAKVLSDVNAMLRKRHGHSLDIAPKEDFDGEI
jgi:hypothetical protein